MTTIDSVPALRSLYREPGERAVKKVVATIDAHCRRFIGQSPFCVLGTATPDGEPDLSPRGGDPGFVRILDDTTLLLADRPGNNRLDSLAKLAVNPQVSLLFFVPGIDETLRVYGSVTIEPIDRYPDLAQDGKSATVLRIAVSRAMFQCPKALTRSRLWDPSAQVDKATQPTISEIVHDQIGATGAAEPRDAFAERMKAGL